MTPRYVSIRIWLPCFVAKDRLTYTCMGRETFHHWWIINVTCFCKRPLRLCTYGKYLGKKGREISRYSTGHFKWCHQVNQDRRWNADKPSVAIVPFIPTWLTTSPANQRPANFWKYFLTLKEIVKSGAISGWNGEDQLQIWSSPSLILHVQIITHTSSISL